MNRAKRLVAATLALMMFGELVIPTAVMALSSGPSQPEVQGFQPAGVNDMVSLFTGDLSYNIPLLDVEGYPVNLFYSAGVGMEQEASWVGLGWNLNPGVVERNLRGLPDDFSGDVITREMGLRPNRTFGLSYALGLQLGGSEEFGINAGVSPSFNNYDGPQFETNLSLSMKSTMGSNNTMTTGLGLSSHSSSGLKVRPSIGFDRSTQINGNECKAGLNFGLTLDSRQGMTNMAVGATLSSSKKDVRYASDGNNGWTKTRDATRSDSRSASAAFDLGAPTYSPQVTLPMENLSLSFNFTVGAAIAVAHPNMTLGAFFSRQRLQQSSVSRAAFGYLHLQAGQANAGAMLDFNREKDGPYSADKTGLGVVGLTNDIFSVSGQGVSGSYRAFRSEVGHVFDPTTSCTGSGDSGGLEFGAGFVAHVGGEVMVNNSSTVSGPWQAGNYAGQRLRFRDLADRPDLERVFFREANEPTVEQDSAIWTTMGGDKALRFTLPELGGYANALGTALTASGVPERTLPAVNYRQKREPRAQLFTYLDHRTAMDVGLNMPEAHSGLTSGVPMHHMSEVTINAKDGARSVYGLPAYNLVQLDVEFNKNPGASSGNGLTQYSTADNSTSNSNGTDHFYSRTRTPAYPYAFLLTAVLSSDYSDIDGLRGPSDGDLGNYTRFTYDAVHTKFPWRTPSVLGATPRARWNRGLLSDIRDDKASYTYGEKEIYHLRTIESRNLIAVFERNDPATEPRHDAMGVTEEGTVNLSARTSYLKKICLYRKIPGMSVGDYATAATPIKTVHFEYMTAANSLCRNVPNADPGWGKLTLRKVWFSYGESELGVTTPYVFTYNASVDYDMNKQDRWGNYKEAAGISNDDFPYSEQGFIDDGDPEAGSIADVNARTWNLASVRTPSGGVISVDYEADDYAYVQDRAAMRMLRLTGIAGGAVLSGQRELQFMLPVECEGMDAAELRNAMFGGIQNLYFRAKVHFSNDWDAGFQDDFVSGYCSLSGVNWGSDLTVSGNTGMLRIPYVPLDEGSSTNVSPIFRAALEFLRLHYPSRVHPTDQEFQDGDDITEAFLDSWISSITGLISGIGDFFSTPNTTLMNRGFCPAADASQSWIRVNEPDKVKKGGGYRVKQIRISDEWDVMETDEGDEAFTYGQDYRYGDEDGSYGVAAFEPMGGADENPWRQPIYGTLPRPPLTPDERFYQETPFGESLFPGPTVGYSKVVVRDLFPSPEAQAAQGTGEVVHEFYTARDFPTITAMTNVQPVPQGNQGSVDLLALLGFKRTDHMHATQGYVVETNDMHGKPKSILVFPEGSDEAISETRYTYATRTDGSGRLSNTATVIDPHGAIGRADIGRQYEFVADMREFSTFSSSGGAEMNLETIWAVIAPFPLPIVLPSYSSQSVKFKSGVLVKKIHRFGLLTEVTQIENGSRVITENLAYDSETGTVLLTKLTNAFEDPIHVFNFPAYWHYDAMGPAYRNIGAFANLNFSTGTANVANASTLFFPGDELVLRSGSTLVRGWVDEVMAGTIRVVDGVGVPFNGTWHARVIRSGRRNMQDVNMMTLTMLSDPLQGLTANVYENILQAQVQEFGGEWGTECACLDEESIPNAWRLNQKGIWRPWKDRVWLTERTRSILNHNTDIRRDGVYSSFAPFYKVLNGQWQKNNAGWSTAREVTHYSGRGQELENKDALGLFSSATFGHRGNLTKTVARNAMYQETGFDGFEEPNDPIDCSDGHFRIGGGAIVNTDAHTGRHSIRVSQTDTAWFGNVPWDCPVEPCPLGLFVKPEGNSVTVSNAVQPITITAELVSGDVDFMAGGLGLYVTGSTSSSWSAWVTVTDASGCSVTRLLQHTGTP